MTPCYQAGLNAILPTMGAGETLRLSSAVKTAATTLALVLVLTDGASAESRDANSAKKVSFIVGSGAYVSAHCPGLQWNRQTAWRAIETEGYEPVVAATQEPIKSLSLEVYDDLQKMGSKAGCIEAYKRLGPDGIAVRGLISSVRPDRLRSLQTR